MSGAKIGQVLSRVFVPAWVLTGALFKLMEGTPSNLPGKTILPLAARMNLDLHWTLAVLIGLEFLAIAVMLCMARLARPMAIFLLSVFCLVLIGEMVQGNVTSCGCLGNVKIPPWVILAIDGSLLLGVVLFDPSPLIPAAPSRTPAVLAAVLIAGGFGLSYWMVIHPLETRTTTTTTNDNGNGNGHGGAPVVVSNVTPVPSFWFAKDVGSWVGKPWTEVELFSFMPRKPSGLDSGTRYVVFYSRTCDHCEDMFRDDLNGSAITSMVTAIEVPDSPTVLTSDNGWWPGPPQECELLSLPLGCDWIMTTPVALRIVDGIVQCAVEGEHTECMELE
ncbi:MAG: hypothetical protein IID28_02255 [Planctomycetes bacterium]|nr:hypothetical protein [Planctomycetota bacterium]